MLSGPTNQLCDQVVQAFIGGTVFVSVCGSRALKRQGVRFALYICRNLYRALV